VITNNGVKNYIHNAVPLCNSQCYTTAMSRFITSAHYATSLFNQSWGSKVRTVTSLWLDDQGIMVWFQAGGEFSLLKNTLNSSGAYPASSSINT